MDDVNGGNNENLYDSIVVTHYDRLFWFFPFMYAFRCPQHEPNRTSQFFYSLTAAYYGQSVNVSGGDSGGSDDGGGLSNLYRDTVTTPWQPQTPCLGTQSN